ncbi:MAG: ABC transporter ATP-binding protein [Gammaproteobacteria bacterium]|nr:ABC transporter ATP-binding protein [Gammaproteobacteria bacterium]
MHALSVRNLVKVYPSGVQALAGIDLDVAAGDFYALLGPNGAGKTSLIGIVTSLVNKTSGRVTVFGHDLDRERPAVKNAIGVVPQEINLHLWDKAWNIVVHQAGFYGLPPARARERAEICLKQLQLWDRRDATARSLSGGMKRRLMIARALVHEPRLLILDEPTAGVDIEVRRSMWDFLRQLNAAGTTIILTTHYLEEAENLCRHVAIIDHGRAIQQGSMQQVLGQLNQEVFVLMLRDPCTAVPQLPGFELRLQGPLELEVAVPRSRDINELFAALSSAGVHVLSLRNKANRLEELFLTLTGRGPQVGELPRAGVAGRGAP